VPDPNTVWEPHERVEDLRRFVAADPPTAVARGPAETLRQIGRREEAANVLSVLPDSTPTPRRGAPGSPSDRGDDRAVEAIPARGRPSSGAGPSPRLVRLSHRDGPAAVRHFRAAYAIEPDDRTRFGRGRLALVGDRAAAEPFLRDSKAYDTLEH